MNSETGKFDDDNSRMSGTDQSTTLTRETDSKNDANVSSKEPIESDRVKEISTMVDELRVGNDDGLEKVDETCQIPDIANKTTWTSIDDDNSQRITLQQSADGCFAVDADTQIEPELIAGPPLRQIKVDKTTSADDENLENTCKEQQTESISTVSQNKETIESESVKKDTDETEISTDSDVMSSMTAVHNEEENIRLVNQSSESFEEELPYVPTTLPLERSVAVPIIPVKERVVEVKTCPVHRPRSTMPLNPALLDNYVASTTTVTTNSGNNLPVATENLPHSSPEKLHITLPRSEPVAAASENGAKVKSPLTAKPWKKFIEEGGIPQSPKKNKCSPTNPDKRESLKPSTLPSIKSSWISFDETNQEIIRQSPRKITTLPASHYADSAMNLQKAVSRFNQKPIFVNPDECSCECHDSQRVTTATSVTTPITTITTDTTIITATTTGTSSSAANDVHLIPDEQHGCDRKDV